jgi:hypothetical protein
MDEKSEEFARILRELAPEQRPAMRDYCRVALAAETSARKFPAHPVQILVTKDKK